MSQNKKGKNLLAFPLDYTVVDLETTGLDPTIDGIIELGAIRVRGGHPVEEYSSLIDPGFELDEFIVSLTGITNDDLSSAPDILQALPSFLDFLGDDPIVGHNVGFDLGFLRSAADDLDREVAPDYINTLRISRLLYPEMEHHRLSDMASRFGCTDAGAHRALTDCRTTYRVFEAIRADFSERGLSFPAPPPRRSLSDLVASASDIVDPSHPLYGKVCVFTGALSRYPRREAAQLVVNLGGICADSVTKKTNYLILGNSDYSAGNTTKSTKLRRAEKLILDGQDLTILSEDVFYNMLSDF